MQQLTLARAAARTRQRGADVVAIWRRLTPDCCLDCRLASSLQHVDGTQRQLQQGIRVWLSGGVGGPSQRERNAHVLQARRQRGEGVVAWWRKLLLVAVLCLMRQHQASQQHAASAHLAPRHCSLDEWRHQRRAEQPARQPLQLLALGRLLLRLQRRRKRRVAGQRRSCQASQGQRKRLPRGLLQAQM